LLEVKPFKYAAASGSEPRMAKVQGMVDKMFGDNTKTPAQKLQHYTTVNDRY
jgi:hypothetical protein